MSRGWTLRLQKSLESLVRGQGSALLATLGVTFPSPLPTRSLLLGSHQPLILCLLRLAQAQAAGALPLHSLRADCPILRGGGGSLVFLK